MRFRAERGDDPLMRQWLDFMQSVQTRKPSVNQGAVGVAALELAGRVRRAAEGLGEEGQHADDSDLRR